MAPQEFSTVSSSGMEALSQQERVTLLEAQIRRREAELKMMHEANRLAVLTLELEKAALEEATGSRQIEKLSMVHAERAERNDIKDVWAREMAEQLEELQEINTQAREEHADVMKKNNMKIANMKKSIVKDTVKQKFQDKALFYQSLEEHRQKGETNAELLRRSQADLQAQLRKSQKAKTKNFQQSKKESEELREMKRDLEEQHVENIQEFRKEVDILALRQKLEKERNQKAKQVAKQHAREVAQTEADRARNEREFAERAAAIHGDFYGNNGALAMREKAEQLFAQKADMAKSRYMLDVEEALARERECNQEVARLQEEALRLEKAMRMKQKKIVKNDAKITELNNKGDEEALKQARIASQRRIAESEKRAADLLAKDGGFRDEPEEKGEWVWVKGKYTWQASPMKGVKAAVSPTGPPPPPYRRPQTALPRMQRTLKKVARAPKAEYADPAAPRAKKRTLPSKAAEEPVRSASSRARTQHAYFSDTEVTMLRDKTRSPREGYKPMSLNEHSMEDDDAEQAKTCSEMALAVPEQAAGDLAGNLSSDIPVPMLEPNQDMEQVERNAPPDEFSQPSLEVDSLRVQQVQVSEELDPSTVEQVQVIEEMDPFRVEQVQVSEELDPLRVEQVQESEEPDPVQVQQVQSSVEMDPTRVELVQASENMDHLSGDQVQVSDELDLSTVEQVYTSVEMEPLRVEQVHVSEELDRSRVEQVQESEELDPLEVEQVQASEEMDPLRVEQIQAIEELDQAQPHLREVPVLLEQREDHVDQREGDSSGDAPTPVHVDVENTPVELEPVAPQSSTETSIAGPAQAPPPSTVKDSVSVDASAVDDSTPSVASHSPMLPARPAKRSAMAVPVSSPTRVQATTDAEVHHQTVSGAATPVVSNAASATSTNGIGRPQRDLPAAHSNTTAVSSEEKKKGLLSQFCSCACCAHF